MFHTHFDAPEIHVAARVNAAAAIPIFVANTESVSPIPRGDKKTASKFAWRFLDGV